MDAIELLCQTLGFDVAGVVKEVGVKVRNLKPGDRVMGMAPMAAYMDYVDMEEDHLTLIPESLSYEEAAAVPTVAITAWQALFVHGNLQPGQRILVHAGSGGVGHIAVQLAKQHGAYELDSKMVLRWAKELNRKDMDRLDGASKRQTDLIPTSDDYKQENEKLKKLLAEQAL